MTYLRYEIYILADLNIHIFMVKEIAISQMLSWEIGLSGDSNPDEGGYWFYKVKSRRKASGLTALPGHSQPCC